MKAEYLFLDIETTGLNPRMDLILEIAAQATDDRINPVGPRFHHVLHCPHPKGDNVVEKMHTVNGLWAECAASEETLMPTLVMLLALCESIQWTDHRPILAGNGVHFDRAFVEHATTEHRMRWPFHYRLFDTRTIAMLADAVGFELPAIPTAQSHRASTDIEWSMAVARRVQEGLCV